MTIALILLVAIFLIALGTKSKNKCSGCSGCSFSLADLDIGECAIVTRVTSTHISRRLADMGFVPGQKVCLIRISPLGDPLEYSLMGYNIALRLSEAKQVFVKMS